MEGTVKYVQPIVENTLCMCPLDDFRIIFDEYGIFDYICITHGPPIRIRALEFDSEEGWRVWRDSQEAK